ncbi:MAG: PKD domain-containing protein [Paludibacter sp.]|nr:PKD domain-containing protein [Paludibacter sp.]
MRKSYLTLLSLCSLCAISAQNNIAGYEYWFNKNIDARTQQPVAKINQADLQLEIPTDGLQDGLNWVNLRFYDDSLKYSTTLSQFFFKTKASESIVNRVTGYRYWFNNDSTTTLVQINPATENDIIAQVDINSLKRGMNLFHFQAIDDHGVCSSPVSRFFFGREAMLITGYRYWFNDNMAEVQEVTIQGAHTANIENVLNVESLSEGINMVHISFMDDQNQWSSPVSQFFYKMKSGSSDMATVKSYKYWFDNDIENVKTETISPETEIQLAAELETGDIVAGLHKINMMFEDSKGLFSQPVSSFFYKPTNAATSSDIQITAYEYWLDNDFDQKHLTELTSSVDPMNLTVRLNMSEADIANHQFHFRSLDTRGLWSNATTDVFYRDSIRLIGSDVDEICDKGIVQFYNILSENDYSYQWNFGDGHTSDAFEPEHFYATSGQYTVQLKATHKTTGKDTLGYTMVAVHPSYHFVTKKNIQLGTVFEWRGKVYEEAGTYFDSFLTSISCDSIYELNLTITDSLYSVPKDILLLANTIDENLPEGTLIGNLSAVDNDQTGGHLFALYADTVSNDNALFRIKDNSLYSGAVFNFEQKSQYTIAVEVVDSLGYRMHKQLSIYVVNQNEAPVEMILSDTIVSENSGTGVLIGSVSVTDPDAGDQFSLTLVSGTGSNDNAFFRIDGDKLYSKVNFNYEEKSRYLIRIEATDAGGLKISRPYEIYVENVNEAPAGISLSDYRILENKPAGTLIGLFSAEDPDADNVFTYSLISGEGDIDNTKFHISGDSLLSAESYDFEKKNTYFIRVKVIDMGGATFSRSFNIVIEDEDENPTLITDVLLSNHEIAENLGINMFVGKLSTIGGWGTEREYSFVTGDGDYDNPVFRISNDSVYASESFDFEKRSIYFTRIQATDVLGATYSKLLLILVTDINESPYAMYIPNTVIDEALPVNSFVSTLITFDEDRDDQHVYSLINGDGDSENNKFRISADSLLTNSILYYEEQPSCSVRIQTTDKGGEAYSMKVVINLNNVNGTSNPYDSNFNARFDGDIFKIQAAGHIGSWVEVYSTAGQKMMKKEMCSENEEFIVQSLKGGIYVINLIENNMVIYQRTLLKN